jgi:alpha-glucosidase (family GH31 glycosyl hydrolase)
MWAKGQDSPYDAGLGGKGVYGVHPFILVQSQTKGDFFGMFFKNSNAQSPVLKYRSDGGSTLSYITTGGVIDIYFFVHGSAKEIIQSYHNVIGKPTLPPFWALGWH